MELLITPARAVDFLEVLDDDGRAPGWRGKRAFGLHARQVGRGASIAIRADDGRLCALFGLYDNPDDPTDIEGWFAAGPALRDHLRPALRLGRAALDYAGGEMGAATVLVHVRSGSVAGERLAAWFGFQSLGPRVGPLGTTLTFGRRFSCRR